MDANMKMKFFIMKQFVTLAWRNLWRNRRRTLITLASVLMAVVLAIAIRSLQKGVYGNMIGNAVRFSTGYIQVHAKGYWDDQTINNSFMTMIPLLSESISSKKKIFLCSYRGWNHLHWLLPVRIQKAWV